MTVSAVKNFMLYCPKCQQTYEEGTLRFCNNDGVRLISSSGAAQKKPSGVFSSLLGRSAPKRSGSQNDEKLAAIPRFAQLEQPPQQKPSSQAFTPPPVSKIFKAEPEAKPQIQQPERQTEQVKPEIKEVKPEAEEEKTERKFLTVKPIPRTVKPSEIPSGTASVGDRKTNPTGRAALTWQQPQVLFGQTIKGRYQIIELFGQDEASLSYLAEDKIVPNKKVLVRILMNERASDDSEGKILAEEIVSLSHINHPNIGGVMDSGELPEGKPFIITEFIEGKSVKDMLQRTGQFNAARVARIIRQASYALSEVHQNGILHRNLKPENIILTVSESGKEQVKLTGFGILYGNSDERNAAYLAPEQIDGKAVNYAADIYSLAVIAYQMLTNRLPFNVSSTGDLIRAQRKGLTVYPTNLRLDLPPLADKVLEKALSFSASDRYPKARDFGDAFFNALTTAAQWESEKAEEVEIITDEEQIEETPKDSIPRPAFLKSDSEDEFSLEIPPIAADASDQSSAKGERVEKIETLENGSVKTTGELPWEKRSPEPVQVASRSWMLMSVLGLVLLLAVSLAVWYILWTRSNNPALVEETPPANNQITEEVLNQDANASQNSLSATEVNEIPPIKRSVEQPPNTIYFENSKQNLDADLAKKFLGFSLYYPKDWLKTSTKGNFLDISKKSADGIPVKQMLITRYDSKGTFNQDKASFANLAEKSNNDLKTILPNYKLISARETQIQNGRWKVYEVKFQNAGKTENGGEIMLWGRRLWIPVQRPGTKSGFVITMLATSLSTDVKGIEDVGVNDELATILETFEPAE